MTQSEWNYVFGQRNTTSGILYAKAQVNGVNGVILLPDDWSTSYYALNNYNSRTTDFSSNVISSSSWSNSLEVLGAVFLPATGCRLGTSDYSIGSAGYYWSASYSNNNIYSAYGVFFYEANLFFTDYDFNRLAGQSVRLVCPTGN